MHEKHKAKYSELQERERFLELELNKIQLQIRDIESSCPKCGVLDWETDWDYTEDGMSKMEYITCNNCGYKEITYEG